MILENNSFDVAIVGYGPVGATMANLLGKAGLSVLVLEREAGSNSLPRAVSFDLEIMRVFRSLGLADAIETIARPSTQGTHFINAQGETLLKRRGSNWLFHQPHLEAELRHGVDRYSTITVLQQHEVIAIEPEGAYALLRAKDLIGDKEQEFRARFVVGCDGARSFVRRQIGSAMEDLGSHQPWLVVDLLMDLNSSKARNLPEYSIQWCDPQRPMTFFWVGDNRRRWEIMLMPTDDPERMTDPSVFWPLLSRWIGPNDANIERSAVYTFHSLIAEGWRHGALLLAGDSCHQTPPFLGQGLCAGIRDAVNLAWKLDAVIRGGADPGILDTYECERRPHARTFIELAVHLGSIIQTTDKQAATERDHRLAIDADNVFEYPRPQLGQGIWDQGPAPNGRLFPETRLRDGRFLEERIGGRFAVLGDASQLELVDPSIRGIWEDLSAIMIDDLSAELIATLADWNVKAVILRPDGYVFGVADDSAGLSKLTLQLARQLQIPLSDDTFQDA
ncbi:bifunctional 3-(3-hydroxy-phenyl)propionate/3-hydroxycinnamic acid hydroxylase [Agrobacterium vitis]|uniref:Bifunctional 3-(3-hydroxy-phenyl)propionate/3-hydroxycinnamic acid hydroxylase n=2 Tax=Agrobacterium vitis TaxID=373 RepID=A0AAE2RAK3_AGRVI|nr:bifunctional 3-(3-hydroxy-phenyl)propionate/3-hydroxycinnamic acid hydroxylase [Agrobacterium vitis]MUO81498.1 bifunctional 3-(3-hydroxy-phenyl)propionate/3-hydroxycinnamic acid hydroxylase [Agrobacterium vitis]MUO95855.1 bifunctional 3-(3-hydroxy-phenyl)propionate/3-hydroxycinnamic acid hydroxylase [Agrobacterium vitis]MVA93934.1 bifunctional 3-(3-hydroxy-phenyl)propionate/3-hydroxycinnamic acid hydroxylase [Agrobacterium vitis]MVB03559.1 bifunctional 3-(3-hydroxy-phenyl)propionate/3-hydrox